MKYWPLVFSLALNTLIHADEISRISDDALELRLTDLDGQTVQPLACPNGIAFSVVVFTTTDCPVANAFAPEIQRLSEFSTEHGGRLTVAHVVPDQDLEEARTHAREFGLEMQVVIDREHELVSATGVQLTPEAALITPEGTLFYRGRINDLFPDYGKRRRAARQHNLRDAIEALLAGETIKEPRVSPIGCYIPHL